MGIRMVLIPLVALLVIFLVKGANSATLITLHNNCPYTIWPATQADAGVAQLSQTGFIQNPGNSTTLTVPAGWGGSMWGRTMCHTNSSGSFSCDSGDCGTGQVACNGQDSDTPVTLAVFRLNSTGNGPDYYDVSVMDGYNLPMNITNQGGSGTCGSATCSIDIDISCPPEIKVYTNGNLVGCGIANIYLPLYGILCPQAYNGLTCTGANYLVTFCP